MISSTPVFLRSLIFSVKYCRIISIIFSAMGNCCILSGVPCRCINIYGTCRAATVAYILSSKLPPEISLIIWAPFSIHSRATEDLKVSIEKIASGNSFTSRCNGQMTLFNSSFSSVNSAPGLEETAPRSIISAPSCSIFSTCSFLIFS